MHSNENNLTAMWKERAKTRHTVVGIRTWHVNLKKEGRGLYLTNEARGSKSVGQFYG